VNPITVVKYLFTLIGIAFLVAAVFTYRDTSSYLAHATKVEGTVVYPGSTRYQPQFNFVDQNGQTITFSPDDTDPSLKYKTGQKVEIYYLPSDPEHAKRDSFFAIWGGVEFCIGFGSIFFLIGSGIFVVTFLNGQKRHYLLKNGVCIDTLLKRVEINGSITVNGKNPYRIVTKWQNPETSRTHIFKSNNLWVDPTDYLVSGNVKVFISPGNPKKYYVDTSFLLESDE
jgi:hypothetical protein